MARHNDTGKWGEELACEYLRSDGYTVIDRNWGSGNNEIDIIAFKDNCLAFVEVKTRSGFDDDPLLAMTPAKIKHLSRAAHSYIVTHDVKYDVRFDVVAITGYIDNYKIDHLVDAFLPPLNSYR